jgi:hypothetical protein
MLLKPQAKMDYPANGGNVISLTRPWKRGHRYGTLLCDLERGIAIDLLAVKRD